MLRISNLIDSVLNDKKSRNLDGSIVIWNFTNRCNLACRHCYSYADANSKDALSTEFILDAIDDLKKANVKFVIFSGGEPLIRKDIFDIADTMRDRGIITYLSTNGLYVNEKNVDKIIEKFNYIGISIDGIGEVHDAFRGLKGAFEKSIEAIKLIQKHGGNAGIRFTMTAETQDSFYDIFKLAEDIGVDKLYLSHLVYSGRGLDNLKMDLTKEKRLEFVNYIIDKALEYQKIGKKIDIVTGNMEMDAILLVEKFSKIYPDKKDEMLKRVRAWGGNSAGVRLGNIDWEGRVKPDPFFPFFIGDMKENSFDKIWLDKDSEILEKLREKPRQLGGKCKDCGVLDICNGGSRSRAYAVSDGDLWAEDPSCYLRDEQREGI
ncbi:MAG: radical SAM protein [Epsilonproteobacteria bacterium]|nr:radical SAM protein [Campylobacterota bacterium]